jgi:lysophospholipase L1-like esterase
MPRAAIARLEVAPKAASVTAVLESPNVADALAPRQKPGSIATVPAAPFDGRLSIFNATAANGIRTRQGLTYAKNGSGFFRIRCVGDSITRGVTGDSGMTQQASWPYRLKNSLKSLGCVAGGDGVVVMHLGVNTSVKDSRLTFGGGTWYFDIGVINRRWGARCLTVGGTITYVSAEPFTELRISVFDIGTSGATVTVDGTNVGTVNPSHLLPGGRFVVTGLADTVHTVVITMVTSSATFHSIETKRSTGFVVDNYGDSGASTIDWGTTGTAPNDQSLASVNTAEAGAQLTLVALGTNNFVKAIGSGGTTPDDYRTQLAAIATYWLAHGDVMLLAPPPSNQGNAGSPSRLYIEAAYKAAEDVGVRMLDMTERWVGFANASALNLISSDTVHPSKAGYWDYESGVRSLMAA